MDVPAAPSGSNDPAASIIGIDATLGQPRRLELIDQRYHACRIDSEHRSEIALRLRPQLGDHRERVAGRRPRGSIARSNDSFASPASRMVR